PSARIRWPNRNPFRCETPSRMSETISISRPAAAPERPGFGALVRPSLKQVVRQVHLWVGLVLGLPMILIGLSGSVLLVQREILWLSVPATSAGESQPLSQIIAAAQAAMPESRANWVELPRASGRPASVQFVLSNRPVRTLE